MFVTEEETLTNDTTILHQEMAMISKPEATSNVKYSEELIRIKKQILK